MSKSQGKNHPSGHLSVTLDNLIGDSSHISCERSAFVINGLTVVSWIYYNPKVTQRTPIIVCHGGPSFPHNYLLPMKLLTEFGYPVIFYDQAGCGESTFVDDPVSDAPWLLDIPYYVEELSALIHHLQLYEFYLYGHAWGACVVQEFALATCTSNDAMLRGLMGILLDSAFSDGELYSQTLWKERISTMPLFTQNLLKKIIADKAFDSPHYHDIENTFTSQFMIRLSPRPDIFTASLKKMNRSVYKELQGPSEFILSGLLQNWSVTNDLWKIQVPTLVMRGEYDLSTESCSQTLVDSISTAWPAVTIPRAGYCKLIDEPHECIKQITRFLNTLEGVHHRYKVSTAVALRRPESSNGGDIPSSSPRQRSASGSFDNNCASPGRLFRRLLPNSPAVDEKSLSLLDENSLPPMDLPPVVILPQAVLPSVIYTMPPGVDDDNSEESKLEGVAKF
mmetsp:Transcript_23047/g.38991  ORF Transcript_23047/g.38991 Transcript_23047/m.38991 type:complete len:450 (-) Transcript_23047:371-1720(-)